MFKTNSPAGATSDSELDCPFVNVGTIFVQFKRLNKRSYNISKIERSFLSVNTYHFWISEKQKRTTGDKLCETANNLRNFLKRFSRKVL